MPHIESYPDHLLLTQRDGKTLGYQPSTPLIIQDGFYFKDLARTGILLPYEDWRLTPQERATDLAKRLSIREIAGLMLYSSHQAIPATSYDISPYNGQPYEEGVTDPSSITDHQRKCLIDDNLRHILVTIIHSPEVAARWNNNIQALCESLPWGIPANNSSDPRHTARKDAEFHAGGGGQISMWPNFLGLAATFSPELVYEYAKIVAKEYRALGFTTALSPQADMATDPRWYRAYCTFGNDSVLVTEMVRTYCEGLQGEHFVNAMVKHWPGGGPCESGRDAHYGFGKYAVYPANALAEHKKPFVNGAFHLCGKVSKAAAVMPYYTIAYNQTEENIANAFNYEMITEQLRQACDYQGVICTDWRVTEDEIHPAVHGGKPWGVEHYTVAERHYKALMAGCDQFGGNNDIQPVLEAYEMGVKEHGEAWMDKRMRQSAERLLVNIFQAGLFDNPYLDPQATQTEVGCPHYMQQGYEAQIKSVILLKNHNHCLPLRKTKIFIPTRHIPAYRGFWGTMVAEQTFDPVPASLITHYALSITHSPCEADAAIVFIDSPMGGSGYRDGQYVPISLQYRPYTATHAREQSIAGGDPFEESNNRCYKNQTTHTINEGDLDMLIRTREQISDKPLVVVVNTLNPFVISEIEPLCDAILLSFDVQTQAILDIIMGKHSPSARLPFEMPVSMEAIEKHCEDLPHDIEPYTDTDGNTYSFGFGLSYSYDRQSR